MRLINRVLLILNPKQPYVDWVENLEEEPITLEDLTEDTMAYLVPELDDEEEQQEYLQTHYTQFFECELNSWSLDQREWPDQRDFQTFQNWFEVSFHSMVLDMDSEPFEREDWEEPFLTSSPENLFSSEYSEEKLEETLKEVQEWHILFSQSEYFSKLTEEQQQLAKDIVLTFAEIMYTQLGLRPSHWEVETLTECCLVIFPHQIGASEDYFDSISPVLSSFLDFLEHEELLLDAAALAEAVREIENEISEVAKDPSNWGIAKTFVMLAEESGIDITDEDELHKFMDVFNQQILGIPESGGRIQRHGPKVGRNDPCPCDSGKKYKQCCGKHRG